MPFHRCRRRCHTIDNETTQNNAYIYIYIYIYLSIYLSIYIYTYIYMLDIYV